MDFTINVESVFGTSEFKVLPKMTLEKLKIAYQNNLKIPFAFIEFYRDSKELQNNFQLSNLSPGETLQMESTYEGNPEFGKPCAFNSLDPNNTKEI